MERNLKGQALPNLNLSGFARNFSNTASMILSLQKNVGDVA